MKTPEPFEGPCPYCKFGLTPRVKDLYSQFKFDPEDHSYGPGHVVFCDENYDDENILNCLSEIRQEIAKLHEAATILQALIHIPENERTWDME